MAPDYLPLKTKQTRKNLLGVKIKICPKTEKTESVSTTFTCGSEMLDKYLN